MIDRSPTTARQVWLRTALTNGPGLLWIVVFLAGPMLGILALSFLSRGAYGQVQGPCTLANFKRLLGFGALGYEPVYLLILLRTLCLATCTVVLCLVAALPLAFFIAALPKPWKQAGLMLVVIPFWSNLLIRTYAWQLLLANHSWLAHAASALGFIQPGEALYPSTAAVLVGLVCDYLPFLTLPLYASVEKVDWALAEAAADLGANPWQAFRHAVWPQLRPGVVAGGILVFVPATGQFVIPDLLGGAKTVLLGNAIQQQFGASRDWPFGSAIAAVAMGVMLVGLWAYARVAGERESEGA